MGLLPMNKFMALIWFKMYFFFFFSPGLQQEEILDVVHQSQDACFLFQTHPESKPYLVVFNGHTLSVQSSPGLCPNLHSGVDLDPQKGVLASSVLDD